MATGKPLCGPGWTNNLKPVPEITMQDVVSIIQKHSKVPQKHLDKGYKFFHGSYVHKIEVKVNERGCRVKAKCFRSMKKNEAPWNLHVSLLNSKDIESQYCECSAGKGSCAHVAALVYQLAHFKTLKMKSVPEVVSKTSCPQQWQVPPRTHGIVPRRLSEVNFVKPKQKVTKSEQCICSTLYNPINTEFPDFNFMANLQHLISTTDPNVQLLQCLPTTDELKTMGTVSTAFGSVPKGSSLAHQLPAPKSDGTIVRIPDGPEFPQLPTHTRCLQVPYQTVLNENQSLFVSGISLNQKQAEELEELTRNQSDCPEWHKLREKRLTSSRFKEVVIRKKDFQTLADRLVSSKIIQTAAMKHGIENEANAVLEYAVHKNVNIRPCGFVINPDVPFLGSSPDRLVYDPNESSPFGVLEVKCPLKETYKEVPFLHENADGSFSLKKSHAYYLQVIGQLAITGLEWGDFCVWTHNDMHIERIYFNENVWKVAYEKLSVFYFEWFLKKFA